MKIMIDTKHDSPEEIKKVIALLSHLIQETHTHNSNIFESSSSTVAPATGGSVLGNLFGDNPVSCANVPVSEKKEELNEDLPPIITY